MRLLKVILSGLRPENILGIFMVRFSFLLLPQSPLTEEGKGARPELKGVESKRKKSVLLKKIQIVACTKEFCFKEPTDELLSVNREHDLPITSHKF